MATNEYKSDEMESAETNNVNFFMGEEEFPYSLKYREYVRCAFEFFSQEIARKREVSPPAPPSTPTMLTPTSMSNGICGSNSSHANTNGSTYDYVKEQNILRLLHRTLPSKCTKRKELKGTDAELSDLFNNVSINGSTSKSHCNKARPTSLNKVQRNRSLVRLSRSIRRHRLSYINAALRRIQLQNVDQPKKLLEYEDENTVSAPECVEESFSSDSDHNRLELFGGFHKTKHQQLHVDSMVHMFNDSMNFNDD